MCFVTRKWLWILCVRPLRRGPRTEGGFQIVFLVCWSFLQTRDTGHVNGDLMVEQKITWSKTSSYLITLISFLKPLLFPQAHRDYEPICIWGKCDFLFLSLSHLALYFTFQIHLFSYKFHQLTFLCSGMKLHYVYTTTPSLSAAGCVGCFHFLVLQVSL